MAASTSLTPTQRTERARKAALARHSLDTYVKAVAARASELTAEHKQTLRAILAGMGEGRA